MPELISSFDENLSLTYPHNNGFADGGTSLILGERNEREVSLWKCDLSGTRKELCRFERSLQPESQLWSDTALEANITATVADNQVWIFDLNKGSSSTVYTAPAGTQIHPIPSIREDGKQLLCIVNDSRDYSAIRIDLETGKSRVLFVKPWMVTHLHFCSFDPEWIGFCHEGRCFDIMDRVWAWHEKKIPDGLCLFDQMPKDPDRVLYVGHERWCHHDRSVLIIAYGEGPGKPRGIYEAFADGRSQRLVSEGERDFHLDGSWDGRWIVVDTTGPHDAPGRGWENAGDVSDVFVIDWKTGERRFVARSRLAKHPSHVHPVFSPDAKHVYYNEASEDGSLNRVWRADNPFL